MSRLTNAFGKMFAPFAALGVGFALSVLAIGIVVVMFLTADRSGQFGPVWFRDDGRVIVQHVPHAWFWQSWTVRFIDVSLTDGRVQRAQAISSRREPKVLAAPRGAVYVQTGRTEVLRVEFNAVDQPIDHAAAIQAHEVTRHGVFLTLANESGIILGTEVDQRFLLRRDGTLTRHEGWLNPVVAAQASDTERRLATSSDVRLRDNRRLKASDAMLRSASFPHGAGGGPVALPGGDAWLVSGFEPGVRREREQATFVALGADGVVRWQTTSAKLYRQTNLSWAGWVDGLKILPVSIAIVGEELWIALRARRFQRTDEGTSVSSELKLVSVDPQTGALVRTIEQRAFLDDPPPALER